MATKEGEQWWDPYETSQRRHFIYLPNSATEILLLPTSTSFIDSYSRSGPTGSTVYNQDLDWKKACKPECIRTGTSSGQRRNNPHPSQSFMVWRLPRDTTQNCEYTGCPWRYPLCEPEIRKALTAQYRSTYKCDFMGTPQGPQLYLCSMRGTDVMRGKQRHRLTTDTEMKVHLSEDVNFWVILLNTMGSRMARCVPTVVWSHTQQKSLDQTSYDRFCGRRVTDVASLIKSLLPQELEQLGRFLPEEGRETVKAVSEKAKNSGENE